MIAIFPVNRTLIESETVLLVPDWPLLCESWSVYSQENHSNCCH